MLVTPELLKKMNACEEGLAFITRFYPNGIEISDLLKIKQVPKEFFHWGRKKFSVTDEELALYFEACGIKNSDPCWYSENVIDSKNIVKSQNIENSSGIFHGKDIKDSQDVCRAEQVLNSNRVFDSEIVSDSARICNSNNVSKSCNISSSKMIAFSENIVDSFDVFESSELRGCNKATASHFCSGSSSITNCMFCNDLNEAEYHLFNKPIDKKRYELIESQYKRFMPLNMNLVESWPEELLTETILNPIYKFNDWYSLIPPNFWKWVATLPGYDAMIMYGITLVPEVLQNK